MLIPNGTRRTQARTRTSVHAQYFLLFGRYHSNGDVSELMAVPAAGRSPFSREPSDDSSELTELTSDEEVEPTSRLHLPTSSPVVTRSPAPAHKTGAKTYGGALAVARRKPALLKQVNLRRASLPSEPESESKSESNESDGRSKGALVARSLAAGGKATKLRDETRKSGMHAARVTACPPKDVSEDGVVSGTLSSKASAKSRRVGATNKQAVHEQVRNSSADGSAGPSTPPRTSTSSQRAARPRSDASTSPLTERSPSVIPSTSSSPQFANTPFPTSRVLDANPLSRSSTRTRSLSPFTQIPSVNASSGTLHTLAITPIPISSQTQSSTQRSTGKLPIESTLPASSPAVQKLTKRRRSSITPARVSKKTKTLTTSKSFPLLAQEALIHSISLERPGNMSTELMSDLDDLPDASQLLETTPVKKDASNRWISQSPSPSQSPSIKGQAKSRKKEGEADFVITKLPPRVKLGDPVYVKAQHAFWPAVLKGFQPVRSLAEKKKRMVDLYLIEEYTAHGKITKKRRHDIIFMQDEEIADCKLGMMEMDMKGHSKTLQRQDEDEAGDVSRALSPAEFSDLSFASQLRRIRPHLSKILRELYAPAQWRINMFFAGARSRKQLSGFSPLGDVSENELETQLLPALKDWYLGTGDSNIRPAMSERIADLSSSMEEEFLSKILMPEALIEICILSMGLRENQDWLQDGKASVPIKEDSEDLAAVNSNIKPFEVPSDADEATTFSFKLYAQAYKELVHLSSSGSGWTRVLEDLKEARRIMRIDRKMPVEVGLTEVGDDGMSTDQAGARRRRKPAAHAYFTMH